MILMPYDTDIIGIIAMILMLYDTDINGCIAMILMLYDTDIDIIAIICYDTHDNNPNDIIEIQMLYDTLLL